MLRFLSPIYSKTGLLILSMGMGILIPQGHVFSCLIQYLLMFILFFAFLDVKIKLDFLNINVFLILIANVVLAIIFYMLLLPFNREFALLAFITAISPTANSAPIVVNYLNGKTDYVLASLLITNIAIALIIPFILPVIFSKNEFNISTGIILGATLYTVFIPVLLSQLTHFIPDKIINPVKQIKFISFYAWLAILFLSTSKASYFLLNDCTSSKQLLVSTAIIPLVICIVNFSLGYVIGGKKFAKEASQSLGQKNTTFTIWLSLTFLNPFFVLGPAFYIIYHNLYNSYQFYRYYQRR